MAGRLLGQLLVMGSAVVGRAVVQAYRQTIVSECPCCPKLGGILQLFLEHVVVSLAVKNSVVVIGFVFGLMGIVCTLECYTIEV
uniref:Uncharacterized protein n=1 Tax=Aegilops tauschii subsp. strangulata TaxID=200361 RepID=A0A453IVN6_AEGTS